MKKAFLVFLISFAAFSTISCATKYIKMTAPDDEIITTASLISHLREEKDPKIVLRTPLIVKSPTEGEGPSLDYMTIYNAIEKEFLNSGFIVRDRALFEQVASNEENNQDYSKLQKQTDTELIIELSKLNTEVLYETNKFYKGKNLEKEGVLQFPYKTYGALVEFKVILVKDNEFAGSYSFNYAPCSETPCEMGNELVKEWKKNNKKKESYQGVEQNVLELFIREATKALIKSMRTA